MLTHLTRSITPDAQTSSTGLNAQGTGKFGGVSLYVPIFVSLETCPLLSLRSRAKFMKAAVNYKFAKMALTPIII